MIDKTVNAALKRVDKRRPDFWIEGAKGCQMFSARRALTAVLLSTRSVANPEQGITFVVEQESN